MVQGHGHTSGEVAKATVTPAVRWRGLDPPRALLCPAQAHLCDLCSSHGSLTHLTMTLAATPQGEPAWLSRQYVTFTMGPTAHTSRTAAGQIQGRVPPSPPQSLSVP